MTRKLSIAIPTYNRAGCLREMLQSFVVSAGNRIGEVEFCVSNNASQDETSQVIDGFRGTIPHLNVVEELNTIEGHWNIYQAADISRGEYVWFFGDDDRVAPNAVAMVLDSLEGYDLIVLNYSIYNKDFSRRFEERRLSSPCRRSGDAEKLMTHFGMDLTFISCIVLRREFFKRVPRSEYRAHCSAGFGLSYLIYKAALAGVDWLFLDKPLLDYRGENARGFDDLSVWRSFFVSGQADIIEKLGSLGYSRAACRAAKSIAIRNHIRPTLSFRKENGEKILDDVVFAGRRYFLCPVFWMEVVPLVFLPPNVLAFVKKIRRRFKDVLQRLVFNGKGVNK